MTAMNRIQSGYKCPKGYKQTEVGVIPEDWDVENMEKITAHIGDGLHGTPIYSLNGAYFFINGNNLSGGKIIATSDTKSVDYSEFVKHRKPLSNRSILLSINGTIGNLALYDGEQIVLGKSAAYLNVRPEVCKHFVYHLLQTNIVRCQFFDGLTGSTIGNLGLATIRQTLIPLPPTIFEQRAIATALSDVDALLAAQDKLIAKKRAIKQAAMQQLLTGKQRLPGFSGEWEVKRLGDVLSVRHGKSQHHIEVKDGQYPILATGGEIGRTNTALYDKPSVLIGRKGTIDKPQFQDFPFWTVDTLFYTELSASANPKFIFFKFLMIDWRSYNEASGVPSLNASTIEGIEVVIPKYAEQTAIAAVLSDMDADLAALEQQRDKTRAVKLGMMQVLLTGRIRLV